jgi:transposase
MPQNFIECSREQVFLLPPDVREWLPADHLVWLVLDAVAEMDLGDFCAAYRADGHGRPAYDPAMMVALLLYAYSRNVRSSRVIERECLEDIAYRVIAANRRPDHSTIARFVERHEEALAGVFSAVLRLCAKAGLVRTGVVAVDGSKVPAAANDERMLDFEQIAREVLAGARAVDAAEDELYGERRGDELPPELSTSQGRKAWLREAMRELADEHGEQAKDEDAVETESAADPVFEFEAIDELLVATNQGRRGWLREARRQLDRHRAAHSRSIPRSRRGRLLEAMRQLDEELDAERQANEAYEAYRASGRMKDGRRFGCPPKPYVPPQLPAGKINVIDPDSRVLKATKGYVQGYNAQLVTTADQIVIAAEINVDSPDFGHLEPMVSAARAELRNAEVSDEPGVTLADAGYWNHEHIDKLAADGIAVLVPPDSRKREGDTRPGWQGGRYTWMRRLLATELADGLYRKRQWMIEAVFGHTKHNRGMGSFRRRGRSAVRTEWRLIAATHNLVKLHKHRMALAAA